MKRSDGGVHHPDYIPYANPARLDHGSVKTAQCPSGIRGLGTLAGDQMPEFGTVDIESGAGRAGTCEFDDRLAGAETHAASQFAPVDAASSEVLPERAVEQREAARDEFVCTFGRRKQDRLGWAAMYLGVRDAIAFKSEWGKECFWNGPFRKTARGEVDLNNRAAHYLWLRAAKGRELTADG